MKAIIYSKYGPPDILQYQETDKPVPRDNEVLIKVVAASINAADLGMLKGKPFVVRFFSGLLKPKNKILGSDIAGVVESLGNKVSLFQVGDEVFGDIYDSGMGGYAEYVCADEKLLVHKPSNITYKEAASIPIAGVTALQGLRTKGHIQKGQKVLINGASGGVGTFAVQIAKCLGAEVTAVCSTRNIEIIQKLGADHVIDYK